MEESKRGER